jgi:hypothetical protein
LEGTGASWSFKIGEVVKPKKKPAGKPKKAVKPKAAKPKKVKTPKKTAAKKPAAEKKAAKPKAKKPAEAKKPAAVVDYFNKKSVVAIISLKRKIDLATKVKKKWWES